MILLSTVSVLWLIISELGAALPCFVVKVVVQIEGPKAIFEQCDQIWQISPIWKNPASL